MKKIAMIIAGTRDFKDYELLKKKVEETLDSLKFKNYIDLNDITIISGNASGADLLGEKYAEEKGYGLKIYPAKWHDLDAKPCVIRRSKHSGNKYNLLAGVNRNKEMATVAKKEEYYSILIAFWNGTSTGTFDMIKTAKKMRFDKVVVVNYMEGEEII